MSKAKEKLGGSFVSVDINVNLKAKCDPVLSF